MSSSITPGLDPEADPVLLRSTLPFPVVGIGASAGGLTAVEQLLGSLPSNTGMAYIMVLHLAPDSPSMLHAIFQRYTQMPVLEVLDDLPIEPNHVYIIPPGRSLAMNDGHLRLGRLERTPTRHVAIDHFFRSLAEVHRERAIAVVMSGAGADGSQGLRRVKERGGVTLVQSPADAEHESMPLNAIATGTADFVLPASDMAQKLVELWDNASRMELPNPPTDLAVDATPTPEATNEAEQALQAVMNLLRERSGHDFQHYKRATVLRRIERRMQVSRQPNLPAYATYLQESPQETVPLLQDMLISVTNFFRDRTAFDALERLVSEGLFDNRLPAERVRAWVAGCATGEEAYSVAMLLLEHAGHVSSPSGLQVFATDIDERALVVARSGAYAESIAADIPPVRLRQFFDRQPGQYVVSRTLRERVTFSIHNLLRDPPFSKLDLVCCRNLLIYLDRPAQRRLLETFHFALRPGGLLFLGSAETADAAPEHFIVVDRKNRIYRASAAAVEHRVPAAMGDSLAYLTLPVVANASSRKEMLDDVRAQLVAEGDPPAAVIDHQLKVAYLSELAHLFFQLNGGELSAHVLHLIVPELRLALRAAIAHAQQTGNKVQARRVRVARADKVYAVGMTVQPVGSVRHAQTAKGWLVVVFDVVEPSTSAHESEQDLGGANGGELLDLHEQLSAAIWESDSSAEALRASNEELQSVNEELRSTSEELETSKEELQSINEELSTVNYDLKRHLDASAKANDDLQNFIAASEIAVIFLDRGLRIQRFTPRAAGIFNVLASDVNRPLFDLTHRLDYPQMQTDASEAFESLRPIERQVASTDGRWFISRVLPYRSSEDRIEGVVMNFIDVTERHEADMLVRAGGERLSQLFDASTQFVIVILDQDGRVTRWNKGATQALGYAESEALGQTVDLIFTPEDRAAGVPEDEMRQASERGRAEDERWHLHRDGRRIYLSGVMVQITNGFEKGYGKIARDLTQSRLAEQQRDALLESEQSMRSALLEASALKDQFLAVVSHELKNPLNLIALSAQVLASSPEAKHSASLMRIASTISAGVKSQSQLIDDLLDLSRIETGKLSLHREPLQLDILVERIVTAVQNEAQRHGVTLTAVVPTGDYGIHADPVRVEQIVWNLATNAVKFTPRDGSVEVRLWSDADCVRVEVADTGQGVDPAFLPHMFEMFRQADGQSSIRGKGGLGIGLALVKQLTEAHEGRVKVVSAGIGLGTTFSVELPRSARAVEPSDSRRQGLALQGVRILLVDDERDTQEMLQTLLAAQGATVLTAGTAAQAIAMFAPGRFDVIVSDIAMPGADGYALIAQLRALGLGAVPAIALTSMARADDRKRALAAGFAEHLGKPLQLEVLMAALSRLRIGVRH
jgi:two-component system CheB/CheR fusion protein